MNKIALAFCAATFLSPLTFPHSAEAGFFDNKKNEPTTIVVPPAGAPLSFADLAEKLSPAVVNISSTQKAAPISPENLQEIPQFPPGSPFEDFFKDFMQKQQGQLPNGESPVEQLPSTSMGSGFIIDGAKGLVVTNNHVIKGADEIRVTLVDNTILDATVVG
ncbi:MAG TPA: hypothetical protein DCM27_03805, partial [Rhodospirillaceae bacterium]|nr:hypothetical protein [Rhodospirillaceae bacterium]